MEGSRDAMWYFNRMTGEKDDIIEPDDEEQEEELIQETPHEETEDNEEESDKEDEGSDDESDDTGSDWVPSEDDGSPNKGPLEGSVELSCEKQNTACGKYDDFDNETFPDHGTQNVCRTKKKYKPGNRASRKCTLCHGSYTYLAQHLQHTHRLKDKKKRMAELGRARERQPIVRGDGNPIKKRKPQRCTYPDCPARGLKRLDIHLRKRHKLRPGSSLYKSLLKKGCRKTPSTEECASHSLLSTVSANHTNGVFERYKAFLEASGDSDSKTAKKIKNTLDQLHLVRNQLNLGLDQVKEIVSSKVPERLVTILRKSKRQPQTITKYVGSLKNFAEFLLLNPDVALQLKIRPATLHQFITLCSHFIHRLRPGVVKRMNENKARIGEIVIPGRDIQIYKERAGKELDMLTNSRTRLTPNSSIRLRNLIMMEVLLTQAPRAGVLENMTLGEFKARQTVVTPETFEEASVVQVANHKTSRAGPAHVFLDQQVERFLDCYVRRGRPLTPDITGLEINKDDMPLFLNAGGRSVYNVSQTTNRTWQSMHMKGSCNPTIVRKTAATQAVGNLTAEEANNVAELMAHEPSTQRSYYVATQGMRNKMIAWRQLSEVVTKDRMELHHQEHIQSHEEPPVNAGIDTKDQESQNSLQLPEPDELVDAQLEQSCLQETASSGRSLVRSQPPSTDRTEKAVTSFYNIHPSSRPLSLRKRKFTEEQKERMMKLYRQYLKQSGGCSYAEAATYILETPGLFPPHYSKKMVADKLRHTMTKYDGDATTEPKKRCLSRISEEDIINILAKKERHFDDIINGQIPHKNHNLYKQGRRARENLPCALFGQLTEANSEVIFEELARKYGQNNMNDIHYISKVLLQEAYLIITMEYMQVERGNAWEILKNIKE